MPIDIASGNVHLDATDASIPGKLDLVWKRRYSGYLLDRPARLLGRGWTTPYEATLTRQADGFAFSTPSGTLEQLTDRQNSVEQGDVLRDLSANLELFVSDGRYVVQTWGSRSGLLRYEFLPAEPAEPMRLASIEDVSGQGLDLNWDALGRLSSVSQRLEQRALRIDYQADGLVSGVSAQARGGTLRRVVSYEYTNAGQLSAAIDALGYATRYEYDVSGRLVRELAIDGGIFSYRYDGSGRCVWFSGLDRYDEKRLRFIEALRVTEVRDSYGSISRYHSLPSGQITKEQNPLGEEVTTGYDEHGRIIETTTATGATTRYEYDDVGNVSSVTDPVGARFEISYNDNHQPVTVVDPSDGVWQRSYDSRGLLTRLINAADGVTSWEYDADGNCISATLPGGATTRYTYRADGTLHQVIAADGGTRSVQYNDFGRPIIQVNPTGGVVQATYDARGDITEVRRPDGTVLTYVYDAARNIVRKTDGNGSVTRYEWGPCRRLLKKIDPLGRSISYEWGTEIDRLLTVVNERGERLRLNYDALGRISEERSFDGRVRKFAYDANGALSRYGVNDENLLEFSYDLSGRLTARRLQDGTREEYEYDPLGRLLVARNPHCTVTYVRDALGNAVEERQDDIAIASAYDNGSRLTRRRSSLGFDAGFSLDAVGRPHHVGLGGSHAFVFSYDASGSEISRLLPGGLRLAQDRDERSRVLRQFVTSSSGETSRSDVAGFLTSQIGRSYRYDGNGAPIMIADRRGGTTSYAYDAAEQLLSATNDTHGSERFQYSDTGVIARAESGSGERILTYADGSRLERAGTCTYEYDHQGRRVRRDDGNTWSYSWDSLGRLQAVTTPTGEVWTYRYDALGRRISTTGPSGTTRFVWCGDTILHSVSINGGVQSWLYPDGSFVPIAQVSEGQTYSVITDHLGVPCELIDDAGTIAWSARRSAWGATTVPVRSPVDCPLRLPGQWFDAESGLHYNRFRFFDPDVGQFVSQDPIGIDGGLNLYRYAPNLFNYVDLLGLDICANRQKGEDFKNAVRDELEKAGFVVVEEVTVRVDAPGGSVRTRIDLIVVDPSGNHTLIECKASATAPYTPNQTAAGVAAGPLTGPAEFRSDRPGIDRGTAVPPGTTVVTVRPGDPIPGTTATAPHPPPP